MQRYEYKVVAAPRRGEKMRGVKTTEDRFALALTTLMNAMAAEGWDYHRADALPVDERAGLTGGIRTSFQNMLIFRRQLAASKSRDAHQLQVAPASAPAAAAAVAVAAPVAAPVAATPAVSPVAPAEVSADGHPEAAPLRLGAAATPAGIAPALGPAKSELAAG